MKRLFLRDKKGITLVELLLSISIISILSLILMNFMVNWLQQHLVTQTRAQLLSEAQVVLDTVTNDIRLSSAADQNNRILDPNAPGAPGDQQSWQSNAATLVLATAVEDTNGNIVFSDPANYTSEKNNTIYFLQNGVLYRRVIAAGIANNKAHTTCPTSIATEECPADRKLAENVSSFSVRYFNAANQDVQPTSARSIQVEVTLQKQAFGQQVQSSDKARMVFRND